MAAEKPRSYRPSATPFAPTWLGWPAVREEPRPKPRPGRGSGSGEPSAPGHRGDAMNDERRCLVIDEQPTIRLGVRGMLADRYEVEEADDGRDALELITSLGDFDVAIVDLPSGNGHGDALVGLAAIKALRKARPDSGSSPTARGPSASSPPRRSRPAPPPTSSRARPRRRSAARWMPPPIPRPSSTRRRGARERLPGADPAPARDPAAVRGRPLDRGRRQASRPEHGDDPHPHEGESSPASRPATAPTRSRSACAAA